VPIGELESMVAELTQGKARIHVVTERFSPHRFASYGAALSIGSEPISLTAFVKQEATGIKGAVMGVLEKLARSKVGDISLSSARLLTVFERVEPVKYADALAAVNSAEPVHEKAPVPSAHGSDQSSGLATGSEAVGAGAADSAKEEDGGIIKWLLGLLFGGAGATELVRRRLDSRIAQLKELIGIHNASKGGPSA
jgi:hypothetical protein